MALLQRAYDGGVCSSRQNYRFPVQDGANSLIRIASPSCCGANDGSHRGEQIGAPFGTEATGDFAVRCCRPQFPLAAVVVWRSIGMLEEGEQMAAHLAVTFSQPPAVRIGGCQ